MGYNTHLAEISSAQQSARQGHYLHLLPSYTGRKINLLRARREERREEREQREQREDMGYNTHLAEISSARQSARQGLCNYSLSNSTVFKCKYFTLKSKVK